MIVKLKCMFGFHKWKIEFYNSWNGCAFGDRCQICGIWSKNAIKRAHVKENIND